MTYAMEEDLEGALEAAFQAGRVGSALTDSRYPYRQGSRRGRQQTLAVRFGVTDLALFGSIARDGAAKGSEVDILVRLDRPAVWRRFLGVQHYPEDLLGRPVGHLRRGGHRHGPRRPGRTRRSRLRTTMRNGMTMKLETTTKAPVEWLRLDRGNPRLVGEGADASDEWIIARLYRSAELEELLQSISENGYLDIEPLVVLPESDVETLTVLEGNRRLATLRLLREPALVRSIASAEKLRISVPAVDDGLRATFDQVSVYPVASRERARAFIGFKHINGPAKWDAYAKARFAAEWYQKGRDEGTGLGEIANAIGDRHDTVKRMVSAIYVLEQARKEKLFEVDDRQTDKFSFSHLYTALSRSQYMEYLGLGAGWARHDPRPDQVPREKLGRLKEVLVWIYGSRTDGVQPVVQAQNPDIKRLGEVLANAEGRHVLEQTGSLDEAHASTEPADSRFTASLLRARGAIREAAGSLRAYDGRDQSLLDIAGDIRETAETVHLRMAQKRRDASVVD